MFKKIIISLLLTISSISASEICSSAMDCMKKAQDYSKTDIAKSLSNYLIACNEYKNSNGCLGAGYIYSKNKMIDKSIQMYSQSCDLNNSISCSMLSTTYRMENKYKDSLISSKKGCLLNSPSACFKAGMIYFNKDFGLYNYNKGKEYINKSCQLKYTPGCEVKHNIERERNE